MPEYGVDTYTVEEVYGKIKSALQNYTIPMLPMDLNAVLGDTDQNTSKAPKKNETEDEDSEEKNDLIKDDIEQVFVRLNTQGTPLVGEELNYSLLKAKIGKDGRNPDLLNSIETACEGIMKPARFITLVYRLYENSKNKNEASLDMYIAPKQFQRAMQNDNEGEFLSFLEKLLNSNLLKSITSLLKYGEVSIKGYEKDNADYRLPYPLFIKIADKAPAALFMLMYRIYKKGDKFEYGSGVHKKMVGIALLFMWYGINLPKIWEAVKLLPQDRMWSNLIVDFAFGKERQLPRNISFLDKIKEPKNVNQDIWRDNTEGENLFYDNVLYNEDILLYVQRHFIAASGLFPDDLFELDDTNAPFDYDHISPQSRIVRGKNAPPKPIKEIYDKPCNKRVWPYALNRADHDKVPSVKFDAVEKTDVLENSFCGKAWKKYSEEWLDNGKITKKSKWKEVYALLWERWKNMYKELEKSLLVGELAAEPKDKISAWSDVTKGTLWENNLEADSGKDWCRLSIDKDIYFYIFQVDEDNESALEFGIYGNPEKISGYESKDEAYTLIESEESPLKVDKYDVSWIYTDTVLACPYIEGYRDLYKTIEKWLNGLKFKNLGEQAIKKLSNHLKPEIMGE
jgi:hypothetical protein